MEVITDFNLDVKKCVVCGEEVFLDWSGEHYICMNGCIKIKRREDDKKEEG